MGVQHPEGEVMEPMSLFAAARYEALAEKKLSAEEFRELEKLEAIDWGVIFKLLPVIAGFIPGLAPLIPIITAILSLFGQLVPNTIPDGEQMPDPH